MKIKEVCRSTGLTEKAVRYYVENGLCSPQEYESRDRTYLNFSEQNVSELKDVAVMRKLGFSTEDIRLMKEDGGRIGGVMSGYIRSLSEELEAKTRIYSSLSAVDYGRISSLEELMPTLSGALKPDPASPDFSKFENEPFDDGADAGFTRRSHKEMLLKVGEIFITYSALIGTLAAMTTLPGIFLLGAAMLISRKFRADYLAMYQVLTGVGFLANFIAFVRSAAVLGGKSGLEALLWSGAPDFSGMSCRLYLIIAVAELASLVILTFGRSIREKF